jgi:hypothetical protein
MRATSPSSDNCDRSRALAKNHLSNCLVGAFPAKTVLTEKLHVRQQSTVDYYKLNVTLFRKDRTLKFDF